MRHELGLIAPVSVDPSIDQLISLRSTGGASDHLTSLRSTGAAPGAMMTMAINDAGDKPQAPEPKQCLVFVGPCGFLDEGDEPQVPEPVQCQVFVGPCGFLDP